MSRHRGLPPGEALYRASESSAASKSNGAAAAPPSPSPLSPPLLPSSPAPASPEFDVPSEPSPLAPSLSVAHRGARAVPASLPAVAALSSECASLIADWSPLELPFESGATPMPSALDSVTELSAAAADAGLWLSAVRSPARVIPRWPFFQFLTSMTLAGVPEWSEPGSKDLMVSVPPSWGSPTNPSSTRPSADAHLPLPRSMVPVTPTPSNSMAPTPSASSIVSLPSPVSIA